MAFPRNSLRAFLQYARTKLTEALKGDCKVNIVIGNESADLDSLSSSLLYAYLKSSLPPAGAFSPVYIPLLNIHRSGIRLRPEFSAACEYAGITTSALLNLDDIQGGFNQPEKTRWILVDHNKLQGSLGSQYSQLVHGVIDHHDEENVIPLVTAPEPRIIEKAGSCTSLIVRYCKPTWDSISGMSTSSGASHGQGESAVNDSAFTERWDAQLAKLALASVLIDTANLTASDKVEEADRQAFRYLEGNIQLSANDAKLWDRDNFYGELDEAKRRIEHLTLEEMLIKDYKEWTDNGMKMGISSVVKPLAFLVQKGTKNAGSHSIEKALDSFMIDQNLTVFAIMTAFKSEKGDFQRELLLQALEPAFINADIFSKAASTELKLEGLELDAARQIEPSPDHPWRNFWSQKDLTKSRKKVAPMLREALKCDHRHGL